MFCAFINVGIQFVLALIQRWIHKEKNYILNFLNSKAFQNINVEKLRLPRQRKI